MLEKGEAIPRHQETADLPVSLSGEINAATRNHHTALNRLITSRLPLALPPHAPDPSLYATGLLHFAHIFLTFESLWADILRDHAAHEPSTTSASICQPTSPLLSYLLVNPYDLPSFFTSTLGAPTEPSPQLLAFLQTVRPRGLLRSARLKRDLEHLLGLHPTDLEVLLAKYPGDEVAQFCAHIRNTVHEKPWTLVSYAWCFYMAVFSGGRWIRAGLLRAGPDFWLACGASEKRGDLNLPERGLSFWHFPGQFDGEDIKIEFKAHLAAAEGLFTTDERVDIIEEAKNIFEHCANLVQELDNMTDAHRAEHDPSKDKALQEMANGEKTLSIRSSADNPQRVSSIDKPTDRIVRFIRRPEVIGTIVALGCLVCVTSLRPQ
ncbi:heme oxygenase-like protein [Setomelanomma holmii]|uniref:Heme oxygenase-like protein n=1 Tax=Setomelanomma holmii TaxID=210430 RepID=A0A9P4H642_9PLEO|nr:heme oxygenase-like protein [Setomelanomma holmii]